MIYSAIFFAALSAASAPPQGVSPPAPFDSLVAKAARDSNDATAHYDLALGYWKKKRWEEAERALRTAVAIAPQYPEASLALSVLPVARGEKYWKSLAKTGGKAAVDQALRESENLYRRAFLLNPLVDLRILGRFEGAGRGFQVPGSSIFTRYWWQDDLDRGITEFSEGHYDRAEALFGRVFRDPRALGPRVEFPDVLHWFHGLAAAHLGHWDTAIRDFAELSRRGEAREEDGTVLANPIRINDYRFILATVLYLAGRLDDASAFYRLALEHDLGLYMAHVQLARIAESEQKWDLAIQERQRATEADPDDPSLMIELAAALIKIGRAQDAASLLRRAVELNPRDARGPYLLGLATLQLGQRDEARAAFTRFLAIAPSRYSDQISEVRDQLAALQ